VISTYLWIALGGALGSVARYWMTNVVAALTGPQFPWGTILINVLGSFVIGLFAYLTTPVGRVPVSFDLRAFVLVGICGGYTTFSSFSLQTLELVRTGHWLQAGGNVVLSVVLCLAAVWAGYALAGVGGHPPAS
jgi:CrcB protein